MPLNKQKGNMYAFVTHTWNPIRGKCPHDCSYCYMKVYPQADFRFIEKEMKANLGEGNFIFVGSSTDMWCPESCAEWIALTLGHTNHYRNRYLFQSKNPARFLFYSDFFPKDTILGTTIETDFDYECSNAPLPYERLLAMEDIKLPKMISIEPIMDFNLDTLTDWVARIKPRFVSIGADSKGHKLPEPSPEKIQQLIERLQGMTTVKIKDNLKRLLRKPVHVSSDVHDLGGV